MCFSKDICPVPFDQQPLNEFYALKDSCFFSFFGLKLKSYLYSLAVIVGLLLCIFTPLIFATNIYSWTQFCTVELLFVTVILALILIRLYLGWSYIVQRLFSATIFYEESGWYDGQIWIKTPEMLTKDRLIAVYYVVPLLQRIKSTFAILVTAIFMEFLFYRLLC
uniref:Conserved hypothetical plastid protein n=1 Tax=Corallina ferreyrae TaxID=2547422 RepID=A0A482CE17_9FLOR|nr:conserved hypothetical plastid protein [Corallina ferreyrae]QBL75679.1 conserved hypothetical plastid protein [Corallina ferreyrae]